MSILPETIYSISIRSIDHLIIAFPQPSSSSLFSMNNQNDPLIRQRTFFLLSHLLILKDAETADLHNMISFLLCS